MWGDLLFKEGRFAGCGVPDLAAVEIDDENAVLRDELAGTYPRPALVGGKGTVSPSHVVALVIDWRERHGPLFDPPARSGST
jgi:hypothetical protein